MILLSASMILSTSRNFRVSDQLVRNSNLCANRILFTSMILITSMILFTSMIQFTSMILLSSMLLLSASMLLLSVSDQLVSKSNLEQGEVGVSDVVKGDLGVDPRVVLHLALELVVHDLDGKSISGIVDALVKLSAEELDAHDGEYQPEDEADEQHVEDGGDGVHQRVDDNLKHGKNASFTV